MVRENRLVWTGVLAIMATMSVVACNSLTRAEQLAIVGGDAEAESEDDDFDDEASGSAIAIAGARPPTGAGGPPGCVYPGGVAGVEVSDLVSSRLAWQGYDRNASRAGTLSIEDYFDCDGSKGINALLIINSATWCEACQNEATDLPSHASLFAQKGIRVLTLMVENQRRAPATLSTAMGWRSHFGLEDFATAADPDFTFRGFGSVGLPLQVLVNPRTMKVVDRIEGSDDYDAVIRLANQNAR